MVGVDTAVTSCKASLLSSVGSECFGQYALIVFRTDSNINRTVPPEQRY